MPPSRVEYAENRYENAEQPIVLMPVARGQRQDAAQDVQPGQAFV